MTGEEQDQSSAKKAKEESLRGLEHVSSQSFRVLDLSERFRELRRRNHFGESIETAIRRRSA